MPKPTASFVSAQESVLEMRDFTRAFQALPAVQREALTLVGANGYSYQEAAAIVGCATGTIKSRVCRARHDLEQRLDHHPSSLEPPVALPVPLAA
jgi:RNA polymerase sigma-70 factor (ECF subfamily)